MNKPWQKTAAWSVVTLMLMSVIVVPIIFTVMPRVVRWHRLSYLHSADLTQREKALNFVANFAGRPDEAWVRQHTIGKLNTPDEQNFRQIMLALDHAGVWRRQYIPVDAWLRWLQLLSRSENPDARMIVAQGLADLHDHRNDQRVIDLLDHLCKDDHADVRLNSLISAAELNHIAAVTPLVNDAQPEIVRQACIILGIHSVIHPNQAPALAHHDVHVGDTHSPATLAQLWLQTKLSRQPSVTALNLIKEPATATMLRADAMYALAALPRDDAHVHLRTQLELLLEQTTLTEDAALPWQRAVLRFWVRHEADRELMRKLASLAVMRGDHWPLALRSAVLFASGASLQEADARELWHQLEQVVKPKPTIAKPEPQPATSPAASATTQEAADDEPVMSDAEFAAWIAYEYLRLALVEGLPVNHVALPIDDEMSDVLRLALVRVIKDARPTQLWPVFFSSSSTLRDGACVVAMQRFSHEQNSELVRSLMRNFNDDAKQAGALLAGLTNVQAELLLERCQAEDVWAVKQMMELGMWLQGHQFTDREIPIYLSGLLMRDDVPRSSILLAMLHKGGSFHRQALDYLLNPRGGEILPLHRLLHEQRWRAVLQTYLPTNSPPQWSWADEPLQQFQIDVLRDWWLMVRAEKP